METKMTFAGSVGKGIGNMRQTPLVRGINAFMASPKGVILVALLTFMAHIFSLEIVLYTLTLLYCIYVCVLGDDFLTLAPFVVFCYIAPSRVNNPGQNNESLFSGGTGAFLGIGVVVLIVCFLLRVGLDPEIGFKRFVKHKCRLLWGMLILGAAYLLSGLFSQHYGEIWGKNMAFGLLEFASVFVLYFLFTALVDWSRARTDYFMWIGFMAGCVIALEVLNLYVCHFDEFFIDLADGDRWNRWKIYLGWGMHNNVGAMLAITSPFALYLASKYRHGYLFVLPAVGHMVALFMTLSRTSILFGLCVFAVAFVVALCKAKRRLILGITGASLAGIGLVFMVIFWDKLWDVMLDIFNNGVFDTSGRGSLYVAGLKVFAENPVLGEGFYPSNMSTFETAYWLIGSEMSSFFPPRWHNTVIQLLASCGVVGLLAYLLHRLQTLFLFVRKLTLEKVFIGLSLLAFLGMSMLDNHFFNLGPTLLYSMALAFAEKIEKPIEQELPAQEATTVVSVDEA
jgi:hypothetical protein